MNVIPKTKIIDALVQARELAPDHEGACTAVAQALAIPVESVREVAAAGIAGCGEELA